MLISLCEYQLYKQQEGLPCAEIHGTRTPNKTGKMRKGIPHHTNNLSSSLFVSQTRGYNTQE